MKLPIVVHDDPDGLWAEVPALPGCRAIGDDMEDLINNLRDVVEAYLDDAVAAAMESESEGVIKVLDLDDNNVHVA